MAAALAAPNQALNKAVAGESTFANEFKNGFVPSPNLPEVAIRLLAEFGKRTHPLWFLRSDLILGDLAFRLAQ